jgi:hypothetical protein
MTKDTPAPYGYCPTCGGLGLSRERRPNGNDRCENGHEYQSSSSVASTLDRVSLEAEKLHRLRIERDHFREAWAAAQVQLDCRPTEEEVARLKKEILILEAKLDACGVGNLGLSILAKRAEEKNERLQERLTQIEKANVDRWQEGYAAAQRQIVTWLRTQNLWVAEIIESGYYREGEE